MEGAAVRSGSTGRPCVRDGWQLFRGLEDDNEVFIRVDFPSAEEATAARERLVAAGVLDRFPDHTGPTVVRSAEIHTRDS